MGRQEHGRCVWELAKAPSHRSTGLLWGVEDKIKSEEWSRAKFPSILDTRVKELRVFLRRQLDLVRVGVVGNLSWVGS